MATDLPRTARAIGLAEAVPGPLSDLLAGPVAVPDRCRIPTRTTGAGRGASVGR